MVTSMCARLLNACNLKQKAGNPRVERLVNEDGKWRRLRGNCSDRRVAPRTTPIHHPIPPPTLRLEQGVTHDNLSSNYFLSFQPGRKVGSAAHNECNLLGTVCEMAATAPAVLPLPPRRPAYCSAVTDVKVHRELALAG